MEIGNIVSNRETRMFWCSSGKLLEIACRLGYTGASESPSEQALKYQMFCDLAAVRFQPIHGRKRAAKNVLTLTLLKRNTQRIHTFMFHVRLSDRTSRSHQPVV